MAMSVDNTFMTNYSVDAADASAQKLSGQIKNAQNDEETMEACKQFESYMIQQIYKNMQESAKVLTDDDDDSSSSSSYVDMFQDNYLQDITDKMMNTGQSLGLANQLYKSITGNNYNAAEDNALKVAQNAAGAVTGGTSEL